VDITAWLHSLGLQQYEQAFRENAIDDAVFPELTAGDLKDLGVMLVGHRRKLLAAIAALRGGSGPEPEAEVWGVADTSIAERRHMTLMFCDLVGSTVLSTRYDPKPEPEAEARPRFDPSRYSFAELEFIKRALCLMMEDRRGLPAQVAEADGSE
jgi:hypothetical protein